MPRKDENTYKRFFEAMKTKQPNYSQTLVAPSHVMIDFEKASINAVREAFPESTVHGCFFHFTNNLWKNFEKRIGKSSLKNVSLRTSLRYLSCLAFFPVSDVVTAYEWIAKNADDAFKPMLDYFEPTYIQVKTGRTRKPASYPIQLWNLHDVVKDGFYRSNNPLESWHNVVGKDWSSHQVLNKFVSLVKKEQSWVESKFVELVRDGEHKISSASEKKSASLKTAILKYKSGNIETFLVMLSIILDGFK